MQPPVYTSTDGPIQEPGTLACDWSSGFSGGKDETWHWALTGSVASRMKIELETGRVHI